MTEAERQALEDACAACLASAEAIAAVLAGTGASVSAGSAGDPFIPLKTYASLLGIQPDSARKRVRTMERTVPHLVTKRGGRLWVRRDAIV